MSTSDLYFIIQWWFMLFIIGIGFFPISQQIFSSFRDRGYIFSKILGIAVISYLVFITGILHISLFTRWEVIFIFIGCIAANMFLWKKIKRIPWKWILFEEIIFFLGLYAWSFIRATSPDIHGLEKYMDFGFINSILRSNYFPPKDMWYPPFPINYYYFGHLSTAVLTKLANIPPEITFNLMLATIFSFTFAGTFSIAINILQSMRSWRAWIGGLLTAFLTTFAGNLHTIYTFFKPYPNDSPVPPWSLAFSPLTFPNQYWYPNATRFIYHTIHEFPIYSFVVSDLHGHVLDIPYVLLTIAALFSIILTKTTCIKKSLLTGFLLAVMYMTNAWDGMIYFLLAMLVYLIITKKYYPDIPLNDYAKNLFLYRFWPIKDYISKFLFYVIVTLIFFFVFTFPFSHFFNTSAIVHGIGVLCMPKFLTDMGKIGPFLFEADHCQKSPWWQLAILYGFFYFWVVSFLVLILRRKNQKLSAPPAGGLRIKYQKQYQTSIKQSDHSIFDHFKWFIRSTNGAKLDVLNLNSADTFVLLLILLSTILIIIPEFFYLKDIYPAHYRANTMFKLVYQSFIMLSISSGYIIVQAVTKIKKSVLTATYFIIALLIFFLVAIYPYFSIMSYYGNLQTAYGLNGTAYLARTYPDDAKAITWINKNITGQPVILEAQGDSYTDYARVSANTGLPTILGWTVHEWLWRGSYDPLPERFNDIQRLYETTGLYLSRQIIAKYHVQYVFVGTLERQKYTNLHEDKFLQLGKRIFQSGQTSIYKLN